MPKDKIVDRFKRSVNAFFNSDEQRYVPVGYAYSTRPDRFRLKYGNERSIATAVYTRIAIDVSSIAIKHVRVDQNGRFKEEIQSGLDKCLNLSANVDQTGRALLQDIVLSMLDEGCVAVVPTDYEIGMDSDGNALTRIDTLRVGKITQWYPDSIRVRLYNEKTGINQEIVVKDRKSVV